jgi:hypothetical protein
VNEDLKHGFKANCVFFLTCLQVVPVKKHTKCFAEGARS